uniref:Uncharacterized protein n=1 Tax=Panagrolaimus sp. ES5 TaxID=591445 RepID=A0AC34G3I0_9BILA
MMKFAWLLAILFFLAFSTGGLCKDGSKLSPAATDGNTMKQDTPSKKLVSETKKIYKVVSNKLKGGEKSKKDEKAGSELSPAAKNDIKISDGKTTKKLGVVKKVYKVVSEKLKDDKHGKKSNKDEKDGSILSPVAANGNEKSRNKIDAKYVIVKKVYKLVPEKDVKLGKEKSKIGKVKDEAKESKGISVKNHDMKHPKSLKVIGNKQALKEGKKSSSKLYILFIIIIVIVIIVFMFLLGLGLYFCLC